MSVDWSVMRDAVNDAKRTIERADMFVAELADVVAGRLRKGRVSATTLAALKRELEDYNIRTGRWKK